MFLSAQPVWAQCVVGPATVPCDKLPVRTVNVSSVAGLQAALANAIPGDRLVLAAGVYVGTVTTSRHGTQAAPIVIEAAPGAAVNLRPAKATSNDALNLNHNWYLVRRLEVSDGWHGIQVNGRYVLLEDLFVHDTGGAVAASGQGILVLNSDVAIVRLTQARAGLGTPSPRMVHGVYLSDFYNRGVARVTIQDSVMRENGGAGLHVWNSTLKTRDVRIEGNTFEQNAIGVVLTNVDRAVLSGNTFIQNGAPPTDYQYRSWLWLELSTGIRFVGNRFTATQVIPACGPIIGQSISLAELFWSANTWVFPAGCAGYTDATLNTGQAGH